MEKEELLDKWMLISSLIQNDKILNKKVESSITYNEILVLTQVFHSEKEFVPLTDILKAISMQKSQLNRTLKYLESKELIIKRVMEEDKRCLEISLTKKGIKLISNLRGQFLLLSDKFVSIIGKRDTKNLLKIFDKIILNYDKIIK